MGGVGSQSHTHRERYTSHTCATAVACARVLEVRRPRPHPSPVLSCPCHRRLSQRTPTPASPISHRNAPVKRSTAPSCSRPRPQPRRPLRPRPPRRQPSPPPPPPSVRRRATTFPARREHGARACTGRRRWGTADPRSDPAASGGPGTALRSSETQSPGLATVDAVLLGRRMRLTD